MAIGNAVLDVMLAPGFLATVERTGRLLRDALDTVAAKHPKVLEGVRGWGLIQGLKCVVPNTALLAKLREHRLLTVTAAENVIRLVPPLIIGKAEIDEAVAAIDAACTELAA